MASYNFQLSPAQSLLHYLTGCQHIGYKLEDGQQDLLDHTGGSQDRDFPADASSMDRTRRNRRSEENFVGESHRPTLDERRHQASSEVQGHAEAWSQTEKEELKRTERLGATNTGAPLTDIGA